MSVACPIQPRQVTAIISLTERWSKPNTPRYSSLDVLARLEQCFEDISGLMQKVAEDSQSGKSSSGAAKRTLRTVTLYIFPSKENWMSCLCCKCRSSPVFDCTSTSFRRSRDTYLGSAVIDVVVAPSRHGQSNFCMKYPAQFSSPLLFAVDGLLISIA